nr:MarR family transcriptional regulator [Arsenicicoccus dermatophilus]
MTLDHQLCFALYAAARATQAAYRPVLADLDLTYPQWLVLLALWEQDDVTVRDLGDRLRLDSGTLSPLLRRLETRGAITRRRQGHDGRQVHIRLTDEGRGLRARAGEVQECLAGSVDLTLAELTTLRDLAHRLVESASRPRGATA